MSVIQPQFENPAEWVQDKYDREEDAWFRFFLRAASIGIRCSLPWSNDIDTYVWPTEFWDFYEKKETERLQRQQVCTPAPSARIGEHRYNLRNQDGNAVVSIGTHCYHCDDHNYYLDSKCCGGHHCNHCGKTHVVIPF